MRFLRFIARIYSGQPSLQVLYADRDRVQRLMRTRQADRQVLGPVLAKIEKKIAAIQQANRMFEDARQDIPSAAAMSYVKQYA